MRDYKIIVEPLAPEDGGGWVAYVPELPGCISDGDTDVEALANVHDAILCWIAAAEKTGRPVPQHQPSRRLFA